MNLYELRAMKAIITNTRPDKATAHGISTLYHKSFIASSLLNVNCYAITETGREAMKREFMKRRVGPRRQKRQSEYQAKRAREVYFERQRLINEIFCAINKEGS